MSVTLEFFEADLVLHCQYLGFKHEGNMDTFLGQDVKISGNIIGSIGLTVMAQSNCEQSDIFIGQLQMSLVVHPRSLPLDIQEVCSCSVGQCVEQTEYLHVDKTKHQWLIYTIPSYL
jgi:hypothetical protein